jgi:hypothetical protein
MYRTIPPSGKGSPLHIGPAPNYKFGANSAIFVLFVWIL